MYGIVSWFDLNTHHEATARAFYQHVVGWGQQEWPTPEGAYRMFTAGSTPVGGTRPLPPGDPEAPAWLVYVQVADADALADAVEAHGGHVIMRERAEGVGAWVVLRDPHGLVIAGIAPPRPEAPPTGPGALGWMEAMVADLDEASAFYRAVFGWVHVGSFDMGEMGEYRMVGPAADGPPVGGLWVAPDGTGVKPQWLPYFEVKDLEAAVERARARGGEVDEGPMTVPSGDRVAMLHDAEGVDFALTQVAEPG